MGLFKKKSKSSEPKKTKKKSSNKQSIKAEEVSDIAKRYGVRVSNPYGYYPEDVDRILTDLDTQLSNLSKENKIASDKIQRLTKERDDIKREFTALKLQVSMMEIPDTSTETDFAMLSRLENINPKVGSIEPEVPKENQTLVEPVIEDAVKDEQADDTPQPAVYDDLVSQKQKPKKLKTNKPEEKKRKIKTEFDFEILE